MFSIDNENTITHHDAPPATAEGLIVFSNDRDLDRSTADQPLSRLAQIWNGFAGAPPFGDLKPVKKFENRIIATKRIWQAIQKLDEESMRAGIRKAEAALKDTQARVAAGQPIAPAVNGASQAFPNAAQPTATQTRPKTSRPRRLVQ